MTDKPQNAQDVNQSHTSDGVARSNLMTRDEFMRQVLYSGQLTRIAQHIALVVFLVAEGRNQLNLSLRDLERITGWHRKAVKEHLDEIQIFMKVTLGTGRAKALFELQGCIEDALATAVVAPDVATRPKRVVATDVAATNVVDTDVAANVVAHDVATRHGMGNHVAANQFVASHVAANLMATVAATSPVMATQVATNPHVVATDVATKPVVATQGATSSPSTERERVYNSNSIPNFSLSATPRASDPAHEAGQVQLNGVAIYGPGFTIEYAAIDLAAGMIGMSRERARAIAEICARDWASNNKKPDSPMAMIKKAIKSDFNDGQIQELKVEKAKASSDAVEGRRERRQKALDEAAAKIDAENSRRRWS